VPGAPPPGAPGALQPQKKSGLTRIIVLVVIVAVGLGLTWFLNRDKVTNAKVGDCISVQGAEADAEYKIVDCTDAGATLKVLKVSDSSDDDAACKNEAGATASYEEGSKAVCMGDKNANPAEAVNVAKDGDCLAVEGQDAKRVACDSPGANTKVLKRLENVSTINEDKACDAVEGYTAIYTWTWKSYGGTVNLPSLTDDVVLCLGDM
jgi:hypothetical protein